MTETGPSGRQGGASGDGGPMILWRADVEAAAPLVAALASRHTVELRAQLPGPGAASNGDPVPIVLLIHGPARALAAGLAGDTPPSDALARWRGDTAALLALQRAERRRTRVIGIDAALARPGSFRARFGLPGQGPLDGAEPVGDPDAEGVVTTLLAERLILGDPAARRLAAELAAVTVDFSGNAPPEETDLDRLFAAWRAERTAYASARDEVELLASQNRFMQGELERLARERKALGAELAELPGLRTRAADAARTLAAADLRLTRLEAQNALLRDDLGRAETARATEAARAGELAAELERVLSSSSVRLTAPLRRVRALFGRSGS